MRESRESDYDSLPTVPSRDVFRGCTSWEHFQHPEQVFPARCERVYDKYFLLFPFNLSEFAKVSSYNSGKIHIKKAPDGGGL